MKNTDYIFQVMAILGNTNLYFIIFHFSFFHLANVK